MKADHFDVAIVGSGVVGLSLSIALAKIGLKIAIFEKNNIADIFDNLSEGRGYAISNNSKIFFQQNDIWQNLVDKACPIEEIRVSDQKSPFFLHFDNSNDDEVMGHIIEAIDILKVLYEMALVNSNITIYQNIAVTNFYRDGKMFLYTKDDKKFSAELLIAADGKNSFIREKLSIDAIKHNYGQTALVFNVSHQHNHFNIAQERFLSAGPFAILPLIGGFHSSIVWVEKTEQANILANLNKDDFNYELRKRFTDYLGTVEHCSKILTYDIYLSFAKNFVDTKEGVVIVGDAAHFLHPIAGQGFNLSLADISYLVKLIKNRKFAGLPLFSKIMLEDYEFNRRKIAIPTAITMHSLNYIFANNIFPLKHLRSLGLGFINNFSNLKRKFIEAGMGKYLN